MSQRALLPPREHGTRNCYVHGPDRAKSSAGCRCEPCSAANREALRDLNRQAEPPYVAAGPARDHIAWLSTQGVGLKQVAKTSGVSQGAIWKLVYGKKRPDGTQVPSKRIRKATLDAILAVTPSDGAAGSRIPAGPTLERVARLVTAGVPQCRIAERCGQTNQLQIGTSYVTRRIAAAIKTMADEMDAGTLVTIRHHRNGDTVIAPEPTEEEAPAQPAYDEHENLVLALAEILEERIDQNNWRRQAACTGRPSWLFFPGRGDNETMERAKKICGACFVRAQCLEANLGQRDGIYGGLSARERREIRRAA